MVLLLCFEWVNAVDIMSELWFLLPCITDQYIHIYVYMYIYAKSIIVSHYSVVVDAYMCSLSYYLYACIERVMLLLQTNLERSGTKIELHILTLH